MALDPALYGEYSTGVEHTIDGAVLRWRGIPAAELVRIQPIILETAAMWARDFNVSTEQAGDGSHIYLRVTHRAVPTPACVRDLKGRAGALLVATSWGGSG